MDNNLDRAMELPGAKRYEKYVACLCPYHGDSLPSLLVYEDWFKCTACGEQGPTRKLLDEKLTSSVVLQKEVDLFPTVPRNITSEALALKANRMLQRNVGAQQYLTDRGFGHSAIVKHKLGYWDSWYTIPIVEREGHINNIMFRASPFVQGITTRRFYQTGGKGPMMYCPDWDMLDKATTVFIVFGLFDAITLTQLGFAAVTPTIGKENFNPDWLWFHRNSIVIVPDLGEEVAANKLCLKFGDWRPKVLKLDYPDGIKDPNDFIQKGKTSSLIKQLRRGC